MLRRLFRLIRFRRRPTTVRSAFDRELRAQRFWYLVTFQWLRDFIWRFFVFAMPNWVQSIEKWTMPPLEPTTIYQWLNPFFWLAWGVRFFFRWILTRPLLSLGPAIPAVAAVIGIVVILMFGSAQLLSEKRERYKKYLAQAVAKKDYSKAIVAVQTLVDLYPNNESFRFQLAEIQEKRGESDASLAIFKELAFAKRFPPALIWFLVKDYDLGGLSSWNKEKHKDFQKICSYLLGHSHGNELVTTKLIYSSYLMNVGAFRDAMVFFLELANEKRPDLYLPTAILLDHVGEKIRAARYAELASKYYADNLAVDGTDTASRVGFANALVLMGKWENAIATLEEGALLNPDPAISNTAAVVMCKGSDILKADSAKNPNLLVKRFDLVRNAIDLSPKNGEVLDSLLDIVIETRTNQNNEVNVLRQAMLAGISPGPSHFVEGTIALLDGKIDEAVNHLDLAQDYGMDMGGVLNNLAIAIASKENADLPQALKLAEGAIRFLPEHPYIRETRGQILLRMSEFRKSIPDLEKSLEAPELRVAGYRSLAKAYKGLGDESLAEQYDKKASDLEAKSGAKPPEGK